MHATRPKICAAFQLGNLCCRTTRVKRYFAGAGDSSILRSKTTIRSFVLLGAVSKIKRDNINEMPDSLYNNKQLEYCGTVPAL